MLITDIISAVRYCIDEEVTNGSNLSYANDNTRMDNIIKAKIGDALRWVCLYAPADLLGGTDDTAQNPVQTGILVDVTNAIPNSIVIDGHAVAGTLTMPNDFIKLARVRVSGWHRAVKVPLSEDSDEYLQLYDSNGATATADRPQAALIETSTRKLEVWPWGGSGIVPYTYVASVEPAPIRTQPSGSIIGYAFPPKVKTAIIYYIAFLLLSAYADARAPRMLEIAKMNLGKITEE